MSGFSLPNLAMWLCGVLHGALFNPLAPRLMQSCALSEEYFDLIDVDSFGSDAKFLTAAINSVRCAQHALHPPA